MDLLMDGLLVVGTLAAGGYCWLLGRRVRALKSLDSGLGGAIVTLTRQIELARLTLEEARAGSKAGADELTALVVRAEASAGRLRALLNAVPAPAPAAQAVPAVPKPRPVPVPSPVPSPVPVPPASEGEVLEALRALAGGGA